MVKAKELKLLRKKIEKADRLDKSTIQKCIDTSSNNDNDTNNNQAIEFLTSTDIGSSNSAVWKELLNLFEENMGEFYRQSSWGLDMNDKEQEFQHRKARYLVVREQSNDCLVAFCHYRFCLDDDEHPTCAVLYVYELQVASNQRRRGWGRKLMEILERLAHQANMPKVVLTVFLKNKQALHFYRESLHYDIDPISPSQHNEPAEYEILSKTI